MGRARGSRCPPVYPIPEFQNPERRGELSVSVSVAGFREPMSGRMVENPFGRFPVSNQSGATIWTKRNPAASRSPQWPRLFWLPENYVGEGASGDPKSQPEEDHSLAIPVRNSLSEIGTGPAGRTVFFCQQNALAQAMQIPDSF